MPERTRVRVFTDPSGPGGNPLLVVVDSASLDDDICTQIAAASGTSETVFVDEPGSGRLRIFVPAGRIPFAGYPLIGTGWLLQRLGHRFDTLTTDAGPVPIQADAAGCAITTSAGRGNPWDLTHVPSVAALEALDADGDGRHEYAWAWLDEAAGTIRARAFTSASGLPEDEATGSAAIELAHHLGRSVHIVQGRGSHIDVQVTGGEYRLSGRVVLG